MTFLITQPDGQIIDVDNPATVQAAYNKMMSFAARTVAGIAIRLKVGEGYRAYSHHDLEDRQNSGVIIFRVGEGSEILVVAFTDMPREKASEFTQEFNQTLVSNGRVWK